MPPPFIFILLPLISLTLFFIYKRFTRRRPTTSRNDKEQQEDQENQPDPYHDIQPVPSSFTWQTSPPILNAPLKPKYHLTMALETVPFSDLIAMDNTYLDRLAIRRQIMEENYEATIQCNPKCEGAVKELYEWTFGTYLPRRFPGIYEIEDGEKGRGVRNKANGERIPLNVESGKEALWTLGAQVDTDFLLLLPGSKTAEGMDIYHLEAFITCFPTGFSTRKKLGLPLAEIHAPVPGYRQKLERSMDKFFAKIECGKLVKRGNWSLTTDDVLFKEGGNHLYADGSTESHGEDGKTKAATKATEQEKFEEEIEKQKKNVRVEECRLRSERQTLFRLPESKALVFNFKTYQYTLEEVKRDGYAEELAQAMEGLREGNVPEMDFYKRGVVWREPVINYLRS